MDIIKNSINKNWIKKLLEITEENNKKIKEREDKQNEK